MMHNDSGFGSFCSENSFNASIPSSSKNPGKALLPHFGSFDSIVSGSEASVSSRFTGLEDDVEASADSVVIPEAKDLEWKEESAMNLDAPQKILTPHKNYENKFDSGLSPDLFPDEDPATSPVQKKSNNYSPKDARLLAKVKESLSGLCPPAHLTVVHLTAEEMLTRINSNKHLFWDCKVADSNQKSTALVADDFQAIFREWPDILQSRFHGLHYNRNSMSEEIEYLCARYGARYVGAETQSTCTIFETTPLSPVNRNVKSRWTAKSPGRRLSHLARRRITFSNSSLPNSSSRTRQILVDAKKLSLVSSDNDYVKKISPNSAKKSLALRLRQASESDFENNSPQTNSSNSSNPSYKRVLFQSPDKNSSSSSSLLSRRSLFSPAKTDFLNIFPRKRKPIESLCEDRNHPIKIARSISFNSSCSDQSTKSTSSASDLALFKEKLPMIIYDSLRLHGVDLSDQRCKTFASVLARVTKKIFTLLPVKTSDELKRVARYHAHQVVKGKSLEEILIESDYVKNKSRAAQRPSGYVRKVDNEEENKENILRDKKQIIASIEKRRRQAGTTTKFTGESRIECIKRVITFDDNRI